LLRDPNGAVDDASYGATSSGSDDSDESDESREARDRMMKKIEESGNWWVYAKSFAVSVE
jgi:hypothetical protein